MSVGPVNGFSPFAAGVIRPEAPQQAGAAMGPAMGPLGAQGADGPGFGARVAGAIDDLAAAQAKASQSARNFELGRETDLASVMVDQQISSLGFQFALNVRNKALGAYRDIMNMPV
ncbi:flagellar hook-basal body complex protein FliE [Paragemmobacter ruber]|uniref:Flagellar hook-basal body complex protein FliE n=1 Tax=Paragemmobacter ruber TaxID=1985673 RepID=A0ABW9Y9C2_9RHOB|nr:flagellar hook-basal body complex protein FliE [Rhodobacter ruber]NBE09144.1 flagellar hook-basal body complex protein FliE [Rhodobacter ruber]